MSLSGTLTAARISLLSTRPKTVAECQVRGPAKNLLHARLQTGGGLARPVSSVTAQSSSGET